MTFDGSYSPDGHKKDRMRRCELNPVTALHTAARRYCLERHAFWCERYRELMIKRGDRQPDGYQYTPEARDTFPRYNVLNAIRVEVERLDAQTLVGLAETRSLLALAGETAEDDFVKLTRKGIEGRAMAEEREAFCRFITRLTLAELNQIEALPYRRVLANEESKSIWLQVRERWQISEVYWYPLAGCGLLDVVAFDSRAFDESFGCEMLQRILESRGVKLVWELREFGPEYEEDVSLFAPHYDGAEGYWTSGDLDWIVYASHEDSTTVAGWLLSALQTQWPSWKAHRWSALE